MACTYSLKTKDGSVEVFQTESELLEYLNSTHITEVSQTFEELANNPMLSSEESLDIYKNTLSKKLEKAEKTLKGEVKIFYKTLEGNIYDNFEDALVNTTGNKIDFVSKVQDYDISLGGVVIGNATTSYRNVTKDLIKSGLMLGKKVKTLKGRMFVPSGNTFAQKMINANLIYDTFSKIYGKNLVSLDKDMGMVYLDESALKQKEKNVLVKKNGVIEQLSIEEVLGQGLTFKELNNKYSNFSKILSSYLLSKIEGNSSVQEMSKKKTEKLIDNMVMILSELGISSVSMSNYQKHYKHRKGVDVTVESLADMVNKVVVMGEKGFSLETMTEEVAHIVLESYYNQSAIDELEQEVEFTSEWKTWSKHYYHKYKSIYKGKQLDKAVRREVLGKILTSKLLGKKNISSSFYSKVLDIIKDFFKEIGIRIQPSVKSKLDSILGEISNKVLEGEIISEISNGSLSNSDLVLYNSTQDIESREMITKLLATKSYLSNRYRKLKLTNHWSKSIAKSDLDKFTDDVGDISNEINITNILLGIRGFTTSIGQQVSMYARYINSQKNMSNGLSLSDQQDLIYLTTEGRELVDEFASNLESYLEDEGDLSKGQIDMIQSLQEELKKISSGIGMLKAKEGDIQKNLVKQIIDKYTGTLILTDEEEKILEDQLNGKIKEESWLKHKLGNLEISNNKYLSILGRIINDLYSDAEMDYRDSLISFFSNEYIENASIKDFESLLEVNSKGGLGQNIISAFNMSKFQEEYDKVAWKTYLKYTNKTDEELNFESFTENKSNYFKEINSSIELSSLYKRDLELFYRNNTNRYFTKEYYELMDKRLKLIDLDSNSYKTHQYLSSEIRRIRTIIREYESKGESVPEELMISIDSLYQRRQELKLDKDKGQGIRNLDLFNRIIYSKSTDMSKILEQSIEQEESLLPNVATYIKNNSKSKTVVTEMSKLLDDLKYKTSIKLTSAQEKILNKEFESFRRSYKVEDSFYELLKTQENPLDFLIKNGGITLNSNFFDKLGKGTKSILTEILSKTTSGELLDDFELEEIDFIQSNYSLIRETVDLMDRRSKLLKLFQDRQGLFEVDYQAMESSDSYRDEIIRLENHIAKNRKELNPIIKVARDIWDIDSEIETESLMTDSYYRAMKDYHGSELDFIKKHCTDENLFKIMNFERKLKYLRRGATPSKGILNIISNLYPTQNFYNKNGYFESTLFFDFIDDIGGVDKLLLDYARVNTYSFFRKSYPKGFQEKLNEFKNSPESIIELMKKDNVDKQGIEKLFDINVSFEFMELAEEDIYKNKEYIEDFEGGYLQPNSKYLNDEYFTRYGFDKNNISHRIESQTNNALVNNEEFQLRKSLINTRRKINILHNEDKSSVFQIPQITENTVEKYAKLSKGRIKDTIKNSWNDFTTVREDEKDYGETLSGDDATGLTRRVVPKFYTQSLKSGKEVSHDLKYSYSQMLLQAHLYDARINALDKISAMREGLASERFKNGKRGKNTLDYKKFDDFVGAYIYGIHKTKTFKYDVLGKEVDFGKVVHNVDSFLRKAKVGASPIIALTGMTVSSVQSLVEQAVGEHIGSTSYNWGRREFMKLAPKDMSETGKILKDSKLRLLGEKFGSYSVNDRLGGSAGYGAFMRACNNLPFKFMQMADYPISQPIMLAVLDDLRYSEELGKFVNFKKFQDMNLNSISKGEIKAKWKDMRNESAYNHIKIENGKVNWSDNIKQKLAKTLNVEMSDDSVNEYFDSLDKHIRGKVEVSIQNLTMNLRTNDRAMIERHPFLRPLLAFRGWLQITAGRMFKGRQMNFMTGNIEEGRYVTLAKIAGKYISAIKQGDITKLVAVYNEVKDNVTDLERKNMKRVIVEMGAGAVLLTMGMIMGAYVDDDDEKDNSFLQFVGLIGFRAVNEFLSTNTPLFFSNVGDISQSPYMALNTVREVIDYRNWSPYKEVGKTSAYTGHSKLYKLIISNTMLGQYYKHLPSRFRHQSQSYRFYNAETLPYLQKRENPFYDDGNDGYYDENPLFE